MIDENGMEMEVNPAQVMKELNAEMLRLVRQDKLDVKGWKELYDKDFKRMVRKVPLMEERMKMPVPDRVKKFICDIKDGNKILDVGVNDGYVLNVIRKEKPKCKFYGIDISKEAIENAKELDFIELQVGPAEVMSYDDNVFDVVLCSQTLEHVRSPSIVVKELHRICKPGGKVIVTVPIMRNLLDPLHNSFFQYYKVADDVVGLWELFTKYFDDFRIFESQKFDKKKNNGGVFYVRCFK